MNGSSALNSGQRVTELVKLVKKITGGNGNILVKQKRKGEVDKFIANIEKAKEVLKWKPTVGLEEEIRRTVKVI